MSEPISVTIDEYVLANCFDELTNKVIDYQIQEQRMRDYIWELEHGRGMP